MSLVALIFVIVLLAAAVSVLMIVKYALEEWRESREAERDKERREEERMEELFD